jgi:hypothetical protein
MGLPSCFMEKKFVEGQKGDDITPFDGTFKKYRTVPNTQQKTNTRNIF